MKAQFQPTLLKQGRDGGREAASLLRKGIIDHARKRLGKEPDQLILHCFVNVAGLGQALMDNKIVDLAKFGEFILGFNASHPLVSMLDCGKAKEGADAKIRGVFPGYTDWSDLNERKEHMKLYASLPTCGVVYAAISHDGGYAVRDSVVVCCDERRRLAQTSLSALRTGQPMLMSTPLAPQAFNFATLSRIGPSSLPRICGTIRSSPGSVNVSSVAPTSSRGRRQLDSISVGQMVRAPSGR